MRFVLIYVENPYSLVRGFGSHKTAEPKIIQMKPQRPSSFRRVLKPCPFNLAHILGRSSLNFQNLRDESSLEVSPASFKITRKIGELLTSGKSFSPIGGCSMIVDYGGDHTFGDSFTVGSHKNLAWQSWMVVANYNFGCKHFVSPWAGWERWRAVLGINKILAGNCNST